MRHVAGGLSYRPDIDGLRAVAVVSVLLFHGFGVAVAPGGFVGVDVFFVISGFLIARIILGELAAGRFSFLTFYARRARRLFPALATVMAAAWAVGAYVLTPEEYESLGRHIVAGAAFVSNILIYAEVGYFDLPAQMKPLLHLWSLGVEEQFYLVLPMLLVFAVRWRSGVVVAVGVLLVASFALNLALITAYPSFTFYMPMTRFWEFLLGVALAYRAGSRPDTELLFGQPVLREVGSALGLALIIGSVLTMSEVGFPGWKALLPAGGAFLLIGCGSETWIARHIMANRVAVFIGLISYPLYLWHWPIIVFARLHLEAQFTPAIAAGALVLSVMLAAATWWFIERPVRMLSTVSLRRAASALTACLGIIAIAGLFTAQTGFAARYAEEIRGVLNERAYADDYQKWTNTGDRPGPLLMTWGDSHSHHLLQGIFKLQELRPFRVGWAGWWDNCAQDGTGRPDWQRCPVPGPQNVERLRKLKPDIVLLAIYWRNHVARAERLKQSLEILKEIGVRKVVVFGPAPYWQKNFTKLIAEAYEADPRKRVPQRILGVEPLDEAVDDEVRAIAESYGATYISLRDMLCDKEHGCLAMVGNKPMQSDQSHFTAAGSWYVIERVAPQIFEGVDGAGLASTSPPK